MNQLRLEPEILAYYDRGGEANRLTKSAEGRLELLRTQDILRRLLPDAPASVLDVGGGHGVHAQWLASDGYQVLLVDPVSSHVEVVSRIPGVQAETGDARQLSQADGGTDATLLLGPLYHLSTRAERVRALSEAKRVTRSGGLVAVATINRHAAWLDVARKHQLSENESYTDILDASLATGHLRGWEMDAFTTAYLHHPQEIHDEVAEAGLFDIRQFAIEGPVWLMSDMEADLDRPQSLKAIMDGLRKFEEDPSLLGASSHLLTVAYVR